MIARYHYENNKFYKKIVGENFPNNWGDLPILEKRNYQKNINNCLSKNLSQIYIYQTPLVLQVILFILQKINFVFKTTWSYIESL